MLNIKQKGEDTVMLSEEKQLLSKLYGRLCTLVSKQYYHLNKTTELAYLHLH